MKMYRQGDVLVIRVTAAVKTKALKEVPREGGRVVLAHGEVTGHAHAFRDPGVCMLRAEGAHDAVLTIARRCLLQHEEHSEISFPRGTYLVRRQREYHPEELRYVAD